MSLLRKAAKRIVILNAIFYQSVCQSIKNPLSGGMQKTTVFGADSKNEINNLVLNIYFDRKTVQINGKSQIRKIKVTNMRYIITLLFIITTMLLKAQQDPMYTQYMFNLSSINPASIGRTDKLSLMMLDRFQWVGFKGAPKTYSLSADYPIKFFNSGFGLSYINDQIGPEMSNTLNFSYAYHITVAQNMKLGMGLNAGFRVFSANFTSIGQEGVDDEQFSKDIYGDIMPNFGLGLFLYRDDFYFGLSAPKMVNHKYEGTSNVSGGEERHYFIMGGYVYQIKPGIVFKPSVNTKFVKGASMSMDINANFLFNDILWAGLSYRVGDALGILTQIQLNDRLFVGYVYDISLSKMLKASSGSHEIMLRYEMRSLKDKIKSPRYF